MIFKSKDGPNRVHKFFSQQVIYTKQAVQSIMHQVQQTFIRYMQVHQITM
jgi:hypothetical protein